MQINRFKPYLPAVLRVTLLLLLCCGYSHAQGPTSGHVFGSSPETIGNMLRNVIAYLRVIVFFTGVAAGLVAWILAFAKQPYGWMIKVCVGAFCSTALIELIYQWSQGNEVTIDPSLK